MLPPPIVNKKAVALAALPALNLLRCESTELVAPLRATHAPVPTPDVLKSQLVLEKEDESARLMTLRLSVLMVALEPTMLIAVALAASIASVAQVKAQSSILRLRIPAATAVVIELPTAEFTVQSNRETLEAVATFTASVSPATEFSNTFSKAIAPGSVKV